MGVNFSTYVGYGIVPTNEQLSMFHEEGYDYVDPDAIDQWLKDNDYLLIGHETGGDFMSGNTLEFFYLEGTFFRHSVYDYDDSQIHRAFTAPYISFAAEDEFARLRVELDLDCEESWHLFQNVG